MNALYNIVTDELYHHGVKGQKHGERQYQYEDGSLTPLGREHYGVGQPRSLSKDDLKSLDKTLGSASKGVQGLKTIVKNIPDNQTEIRYERLDLSNMSDKQLRDKINRELLERQYNDVFNPKPTPQKSRGKEAVNTALEIGGGILAVGSSALTIAMAMKELGL